MKKIFLLGLLTLIVIVSCQNNQEVIPEEKQETEALRTSPIKIEDSHLDPTTPEDLGFEYEEGSSSSTASHPFLYKLIKVQFASGTTEEQKIAFRSNSSLYGLNGWEFFYYEKCITKPNIEFWTVRIQQSQYDPAVNDPVEAIKGNKAGPGNGGTGGDEPIECTAQEIEDKVKECL
ncbi:exported protein of unknown function [Tenacibaculum sp. 190130A14a]|uniref:Lipoprotein n=1 Tax=Tenacibaculum polynesiense TaxID=3137857 RepID=A0ABM9P786_9FLAO